jgi:hypothetical protein
VAPESVRSRRDSTSRRLHDYDNLEAGLEPWSNVACVAAGFLATTPPAQDLDSADVSGIGDGIVNPLTAQPASTSWRIAIGEAGAPPKHAYLQRLLESVEMRDRIWVTQPKEIEGCRALPRPAALCCSLMWCAR